MLYLYDEDIKAQSGFEIIAGVDEAGRGPLAGPVTAAAIILPKEPIVGINDSKKLTPKKRDELYKAIIERIPVYSIGWASPREIDELNILQASLLAMRRAVEGLSKQPEFVLVDGNQDPLLSVPCSLIVKGDGKSAHIGAASILAKVERDRYMVNLGLEYPEFQFEKHKGYPTKLHYEMLNQWGPTPHHRQSFLKKWRRGKSE